MIFLQPSFARNILTWNFDNFRYSTPLILVCRSESKSFATWNKSYAPILHEKLHFKSMIEMTPSVCDLALFNLFISSVFFYICSIQNADDVI